MYEPQYPTALLEASPAERVAFFDHVRTKHALLEPVEAVIESIWPDAKKAPELQSHCILYGHTGTGKTSYCQKLRERHARVPQVEVDRVPVVWFRCPIPFTAKEFYYKGLEAYQALAPHEAVWVHDRQGSTKLEKNTEGALKRRLFDLAHRSQTLVWILDEVQHIRYGQGIGYTIERTLDQLKHLADEAGVMLLLAGTYQTLDLFGHNTQLTRRFRRVLLDRYRHCNADDAHDPGNMPWLQVLQSFDNLLPLARPSHLTRYAPMLHRATLGLVGLLQPLLREALRRTLRASADRVTAEMLTTCCLSERELKDLSDQIGSDERADEGAGMSPPHAPLASTKPKGHRAARRPSMRRPVGDHLG